MRSKTKLRSFTLALFSLLLVLLIAVPSKLTAQAVTVPGDEDVYYDEGIFGITKYRYDHNTKTIYLSHAKEQSLYLTSGQRFLSSVYIHEADNLLKSLTPEYLFYNAMRDIAERLHIKT